MEVRNPFSLLSDNSQSSGSWTFLSIPILAIPDVEIAQEINTQKWSELNSWEKIFNIASSARPRVPGGDTLPSLHRDPIPHWPGYSLPQKRTPWIWEHCYWWRCTSLQKQLTENLLSGVPGTQSKTTWTNQAAWRKLFIFFPTPIPKLQDSRHVSCLTLSFPHTAPKQTWRTRMLMVRAHQMVMLGVFRETPPLCFFSPISKARLLSGSSEDSLSNEKRQSNRHQRKPIQVYGFLLGHQHMRDSNPANGSTKTKINCLLEVFSAFFWKTCKLWN